ncbi:ParB/RepB/Spo0J family partition protein [Paraburkholderia sp. MMS20-SJTR3]|uniref:ParB/RepB/Spo0J family partition protein n=1 Tax=Paraburkholderia sejongensis TaxID=2886946 RepID=A0ABS8K5R1_9BURK|nr:ParB/RepB/Spo0J family partition protein [Paraburkholderia sp. MMS20-SJTR3]MCC8397476.1 ParB/RepB/Spo0J family partition protein [Paraburkholderia sp. MMS20-SJTR3]
MNMRERLKANTQNLVPAAERQVVEPAADNRPKTGIGLMTKLSQAEQRIAELEAQGAQSVLPVSKIRPNPWQPRTRFAEAKLRELAESIKEVGLMQPVLVRRITLQVGEEYFELIAGERRWRAHQLLKRDDIKAIVVEVSDADMAVMALTENISREDLTDYEIGKAMRRAEKEFPDRKKMAEEMGLSRSSLYRYMAFENLPPFMLEDLERSPALFSGNAASDTNTVLKKFGPPAHEVAGELWKQLVSGSVEQSKFAKLLEGSMLRRGTVPATTNRDIHKVYAGKAHAGSITKDSVSFTVKLKSAILTEAQEERIRSVINELFGDIPRS